MFTRGKLIGEVPGIKAHLECRGLILSERGSILAIPELDGRVSGVDMSHEAAVGKIAEEGLPEHLQGEIKKAVRTGKQEKRLL